MEGAEAGGLFTALRGVQHPPRRRLWRRESTSARVHTSSSTHLYARMNAIMHACISVVNAGHPGGSQGGYCFR